MKNIRQLQTSNNQIYWVRSFHQDEIHEQQKDDILRVNDDVRKKKVLISSSGGCTAAGPDQLHHVQTTLRWSAEHHIEPVWSDMEGRCWWVQIFRIEVWWEMDLEEPVKHVETKSFWLSWDQSLVMSEMRMNYTTNRSVISWQNVYDVF